MFWHLSWQLLGFLEYQKDSSGLTFLHWIWISSYGHYHCRTLLVENVIQWLGHCSLLCPVLWCDNNSALSLASNPFYHETAKHIEVEWHFVRKKVISGDILIKFISTNNQLEDIFTKGLSIARLQLLKSRLMVDSTSISLWGDFSDDNSAVITDPTLEPHKRKVVSYSC